jgi:hypothetical protein
LNVNIYGSKHVIEGGFVLFADLHNVNVVPREGDEGDVAAVVVQDATDFIRARTQRTDSLKKVSDLYMHEHVITDLEACMAAQAFQDWQATVTLVARAPNRQLQLHCLKGCILEAMRAAEAMDQDTSELCIRLQVWQQLLQMHAVSTHMHLEVIHCNKPLCWERYTHCCREVEMK